MRNLKDYSMNYESHPFEKMQVEYRRKKVIEILNKYNHKQILEVGCGFEPIFKYFNDFNKLVIVEPSNIFSKHVLREIEANPTLASAVEIFNLIFEDSTKLLQNYKFDFIIISSLLHEIENVDLFLRKLKKIINKNTVIHINVPSANSFHRLLALEMKIINSKFEMSESNIKLQQQRVFDMNSLSQLVIKSGFEIIDTGSYFIKPFSHDKMAELLEKKIIGRNALDGLYKMTKYMPDLGSEIFINFKIHD